jgi:hypothetical protein
MTSETSKAGSSSLLQAVHAPEDDSLRSEAFQDAARPATPRADVGRANKRPAVDIGQKTPPQEGTDGIELDEITTVPRETRTTTAASRSVHGRSDARTAEEELVETRRSSLSSIRLRHRTVRTPDLEMGPDEDGGPSTGTVAVPAKIKVRSSSYPSIISFGSIFMAPFNGATYSRTDFRDKLLRSLPREIQTALTEALIGDNGHPDKGTVMLAHVPHGLTAIVADIHAHSMGYDRRQGDQFGNLLKVSHGNGRILFGSIPQYCGGAGHYSTAVPTAATMKNAAALDERVVEDWLAIYDAATAEVDGPRKAEKLKLAARADISITGLNFSDDPPIEHQGFTDPAGYIRALLLDDRADFPAIGEITGIKELVSRQLGNDWRWNVNSTKFQEFLTLVNQTGQLVVLHNDWGEHALSEVGRAAPAKQNYEHLEALQFVFSTLQHNQVQVIFAHTGIGRFVRPNDRMLIEDHEIKTWEWDPATGQGRVTDRETKSVTAPEHIHQIYRLFEKVPNARADISWNDVTQAYMDLMHSNPAAAKAIVWLFIDHGDRIMFGSDTVKPVNSSQYHQSLMTGAPLLAEIARLDIVRAGGVDGITEENSVAFKILRGNYDRAMETAYARVSNWKGLQTIDGNRFNTSKMDERRRNLNEPRRQLHRDAFEAFITWADLIEKSDLSWTPTSNNFSQHPVGLFPELYKSLPESVLTAQDAGTATGVGTSGGSNNDSTWRQVSAEVLDVGLLGITAGAVYGLSRATGLPGDGGAKSDRVNDGAFLLRSVLSAGRIFYTEKLRLEWEKIFEERNVTREGLDQYVSRLFNAADALSITPEQRARIGAATEQFWANYHYLSNKEPSTEWTKERSDLAIHATIGAYQITVNRELHLQDSSINATDARRPMGKALRALALSTYGVNVAHSIQWFINRDLHVSKETMNIPAEAAFLILFGLGNLMNGVKEARSLAGGILGITDKETDKLAQSLQLGSTGLLTVGGALWSVDDLLSAINVKSHAGIAVDVLSALIKGAFTFYLAKNFRSEYAKFNANPVGGPRQQAVPQLLVQGLLFAAVMIAISAGGTFATEPAGSHAGA